MKDKVRITVDDIFNEGLMMHKDSLKKICGSSVTANDAENDAWMIYDFKDNTSISKKQLF